MPVLDNTNESNGCEGNTNESNSCNAMYAFPHNILFTHTANYPDTSTQRLFTHAANYPVTSIQNLFCPSTVNNYSITLAIGVLAVILLIIIVLTVVVLVTMCLKNKRSNARHSTDDGRNDIVYDYPVVGQNNTRFITPMRNEAYAVTKIKDAE